MKSKGLGWGGSLIRPEATGFGAVYFVQTCSKDMKGAEGKNCLLFPVFGNVAWGAITKIDEHGGKVVMISGPDGHIDNPSGIRTQVLVLARSSCDKQ